MEPPHGDWLTVTKKKKQQGAHRNKDKIKEQSKEDMVNRFAILIHDDGSKVKQANLFSAGSCGTKEVAQAPFNPKKWAKKRSRKEDHIAKKDPTLKIKEVVPPISLMGRTTQSTKAHVSTPFIKDLGHGIKTTLPLVKVSNNHFIMVDEDKAEDHKQKERVSGGQPHGTGVGIISPLFKQKTKDKDDGMDCEINSSSSSQNPDMETNSFTNETAHDAMQT